jgi:hypothetical protein
MLQEKILIYKNYKKLMLLFVSLLPFYSNCQIVDSITCKINFAEYENIMKQNVKERSVYTLKNKKEIQKLYANDSIRLLVNYPIDTLFVVTSMPLYKLKKNKFDNNGKVNVLNKIDFSNNFQEQYSNIYFKDEIVFETNYINQDSLGVLAVVINSLTMNSFDEPMRYGHLKGFLMKLGLERKYFTFFIKNCPIDHMFIVDEGKVYAVFNPKPNGSFEKMEINDYFLKKYNKKFVFDKKRLLRKRFKEKYFFEIK